MFRKPVTQIFTPEQIRDLGAEYLAKCGYENLTMQDFTKSIGVSIASLNVLEMHNDYRKIIDDIRSALIERRGLRIKERRKQLKTQRQA